MDTKVHIENSEIEKEATKPQNIDPRKNMFVVHSFRDANMMKTFAKFYTRIKHPRAQFNMIILGIACYTAAIKIDGLKTPGLIVCYVVGTLLIALALFRHQMSLISMRNNPEIHEGEELYYFFGRTGIRATADGKEIKLGNYKDVYRVWEDEFNFFIGFESEDLIVLPKANFEEGDSTKFRDFILEKTGAKYRWTPALLSNRIKGFISGMKEQMSSINLEDAAKNNSNKKR